MIGNNCKRSWIMLVSGCLLALSVQAAEIRVSVDRNPVSLNESIQITFTASDQPNDTPDFAPLETNFEILNQQRSSNMSWVNGKSSRNEQWVVSVMAKHSGELLIPSIAFGSDSSKPMQIKVTDAPQAPSSNEDVFLDVAIAPEHPYVQSQVLYTLKLFRRVQITQASLTEPEIKDAVVEKLGEDSTYSTQINGIDYWVTERKYAIFPQQSGLFTIAPLTLTAEIVANQRPRFNGFFNRQMTETRRVASKAVTLNVQPVPKSFTDPAWLSAESLKLEESWSDNRLQIKVGEPLTRTITLTAKGTTVGQLPELSDKTPIDGIKTYPDQPVLKEDKQSDGLIAVREEKIAYIPSKAGEFTVPALTISWFNTKNQKVEVASLPAVTIQALATGNQPIVTAPPSTQLQQQPESVQPIPVSTIDSLFWQGLSGFLTFGWLLTSLMFYRRSRHKPSSDKKLTPKAAVDEEQKALKIACQQHHPQAAKRALLQWGKQQFAADNLTSIARYCSQPLQDEIVLLNQCLYADKPTNWNGQALWQAFSKTNTIKKDMAKQDTALEPLYRL